MDEMQASSDAIGGLPLSREGERFRRSNPNRGHDRPTMLPTPALRAKSGVSDRKNGWVGEQAVPAIPGTMNVPFLRL
jgi:hypothetical protein